MAKRSKPKAEKASPSATAEASVEAPALLEETVVADVPVASAPPSKPAKASASAVKTKAPASTRIRAAVLGRPRNVGSYFLGSSPIVLSVEELKRSGELELFTADPQVLAEFLED